MPILVHIAEPYLDRHHVLELNLVFHKSPLLNFAPNLGINLDLYAVAVRKSGLAKPKGGNIL